MMDENMKKAVCMVFEAPLPDKKTEFLQKISLVLMTKESPWYEILRSQVGYIHKGAWLSAALVFFAVILILSRCSDQSVLSAGALTPFLALAVLIESSRSNRCGMAELEAASKYSLKSVVFSKMLIVGIFDAIVLLPVIAAVSLHAGYGFLLASSYILVPYLMTMWLGLLIETSWIGKMIPYSEAAVSILVSAFFMLSVNRNFQFMQPVYGIWWEILNVGLIIMIMAEGKQMKALLEEPVWN